MSPVSYGISAKEFVDIIARWRKAVKDAFARQRGETK
jgi:hypothetical protein